MGMIISFARAQLLLLLLLLLLLISSRQAGAALRPRGGRVTVQQQRTKPLD